MKKLLKATSITILTLGILYLGILISPSFLFANKVEYNHCTVFSDDKIDGNIKFIIDDATKRIAKSQIYDSTFHFNLYICNMPWRFMLLNQGNSMAMGTADQHLTRHIYFRKCDIPNNQSIPRQKPKFSLSDRPLSYYFAHEMTHILESLYTGRFRFGTPVWLREGYADYIAKDGNFDFNENLKLLHSNAPELDPKQGLYRYYNLFVAYLIDKKGLNIKLLYGQTPELETLKPEIMNLATE